MNTETSFILKKGYILFPKVLFEEQMKINKKAQGHFEAFILVLTHVNYSTIECCVNGHRFECQRGESIMSFNHWAEIFGWRRSRTRYFFNKMFDEGIIERVVNPYTTHIRVPDYDILVGKSKPKASINQADSKAFDEFWNAFHEQTQQPKQNIGRARREWKKLSDREKKLAMKNIEEYYFHLSSTKYCQQAATYLSSKAFENEYID